MVQVSDKNYILRESSVDTKNSFVPAMNTFFVRKQPTFSSAFKLKPSIK